MYGGAETCILNLGSGWRRAINVTHRSRTNCIFILFGLRTGLDDLQGRNLMPMLGTEPCFLNQPSLYLDTLLTELSQLLFYI
jgi:hypothetical protein